jgi:hypothetical protein
MSHDPDALNRWLAEHVLGLTVFKCFGYWWAVPPTCKEGDALPSTYILPDPYHSFADCAALLDKVEKDRWDWEWYGTCRGKYFAALRRHLQSRAEVTAEASTRQAALCLAVAKAYHFEECHEKQTQAAL